MQKTLSTRVFRFSPAELSERLARRIRAARRHMSETRSTIRKIRAYWSMTDAQLRARGLKREDIIRLVQARVI